MKNHAHRDLRVDEGFLDFFIGGRNPGRTKALVYFSTVSTAFAGVLLVLMTGVIFFSVLSLASAVSLFYFIRYFSVLESARDVPCSQERLELKVRIAERQIAFLNYAVVLPSTGMVGFFVSLLAAMYLVPALSDLLFMLPWAVVTLVLFKVLTRLF